MTELKLCLYQHYKGNFYQVIGLCRHSETLEILVTYQALYGGYALWVRPMDLFLGMVEENGQLVPRFKFIRKLFQEPPTLR
ncbi:MAG: DUF1653 domain-containing protein [Alphaproteobacteria bacterium]|nr:DUF1653 domain-containing protein [Alphaproteobacteria bacterium]